MKGRLSIVLFVSVMAILFLHDWFFVQMGWREPPPSAPTAEEILEIDRRLAAIDPDPLRLAEVEFVRLATADPVFDHVLEFRFDRTLSGEERGDFGNRKGIWAFSVHIEDAYGDVIFDQLAPSDFSPKAFGEDVATAFLHEGILHPKKRRMGVERDLFPPVDEAFRPGGGASFSFCLYRLDGMVTEDGHMGGRWSLVAEWRSAELEESESGKWRVPGDYDATPSAEAVERFERMRAAILDPAS